MRDPGKTIPRSILLSAVIVCVLTGHGLKDPTTAEAQAGGWIEAEATVGSVAVALGW